MKVVRQILACLVSLLMVLVVIEGGLRLFGFGPRPTMNRFDPELGWTKTPSTSLRRRTSEFDVTLHTNSRGLREDESVEYEKPEGQKRILMIGDSFALGYTVDRPDTITELLEQRLTSEGRPAQVINGGTEGYSTDQEVLWLAREGRRYAPDIVVLQMYENDVYWNGQDRYLRYPKPRLSGGREGPLPALKDPGLDPWIVRHTALGSMIHNAFSTTEVPRLSGSSLPAEWGTRLDVDAEGWPETEAALEAFARTAEEIGAVPVVLIVPDKAEISPEARQAMASVMADPRYDPDRPFDGMLTRAIRTGLRVVDPRQALVKRMQEGVGPLYYEQDWHTTVQGNRVLAEQLALALSPPNLLGPPNRPATPWAELPPPPSAAARLEREALIVVAIWLLLGTLYHRRFPEQGALASYGSVGGFIALIVVMIVGIAWLTTLLPLWLQRWVGPLVIIAILGAALWTLRRRIPVMGELFVTFVRRGQWYVLPVLAGLLSLGALLVVAASSPWLAPFIYTLF